MRRISKLFLIFFLSALLIISLPAITRAEDHATYNAPNITYGNISCGTGQIHANQSCWWCWINYSERTMHHSFFSYEEMDSYYNSSGDSLIIDGGETFTLSAFNVKVENIPTSEPSLFGGIILFIQGLFV